MTVANTGMTVLQSAHTYLRGNALPDWRAWTVEEAAKETGYNAEYVRRLCRDDKIEYQKIGRILLIKADSLIAYVKDAQGSDDKRFGPK